jgi:hypothetical protein
MLGLEFEDLGYRVSATDCCAAAITLADLVTAVHKGS